MQTAEEFRVFIIDDDEAVRDALALLMQSDGLPARAFASSREFLESDAVDQDGVCLVVDLNMPDMNGADLLDRLQAMGHWQPVIIVTAFPDSVLAGRARLAGVRAILRKPFHDELLLNHVHEALNVRGPVDSR